MSNIDICFKGSYSFDKDENSVFKCEYAQCGGIYLWAVKQRGTNQYLVHYIGETNSLARRHKEHLVAILGLSYGIFNKEKLKDGEVELEWEGLWRLKDDDAPRQLIEKYEGLINKTLDYISVIEIFFAKIDTSAEERKHIEGSIGWNLRSNHQDYKNIYPDDNHIRTKNVKDNSMIRISFSHDIKGIDEFIEI